MTTRYTAPTALLERLGAEVAPAGTWVGAVDDAAAAGAEDGDYDGDDGGGGAYLMEPLPGGAAAAGEPASPAAQEPAAAAEDAREDSGPAPSVLEVTLCLCTGGGGADAGVSAEWPAEAGGFVCFMTADEELLTVPAKRNALSLVLKEPGLMSFVKLVTARAEGVRYDVSLHFLVASPRLVAMPACARPHRKRESTRAALTR